MDNQEVNAFVEIHSDVINRKDQKLEGLRVILTLSSVNQNQLLLKLYCSNTQIRLVDAEQQQSQSELMSGGDLVGNRDPRVENLRIVLVFYYANPQDFNDLCVRVECNRTDIRVERDFDANTGIDESSPSAASPQTGDTSPQTGDTTSQSGETSSPQTGETPSPQTDGETSSPNL